VGTSKINVDVEAGLMVYFCCLFTFQRCFLNELL